MPAQNNFQCVLQACISQAGKFCKILLKISKAKNVPQTNSHQFSLMISTQPKSLVRIVFAITKISQRFLGTFPLSQATTHDQLINEIGGSNGDLSQKLRPVEK